MNFATVVLTFVLVVRVEGLNFWENRRVNCGVSVWSEWNVPARDGTRSRSRTVVRQPRNGGTPCPPLIDTQGRRVNQFHGRLAVTVGGGGNELTILPRDLLFIVDASGGISATNWTITKRKLADLIEKFCGSIDPGKQGNRIAVITFSRRVVLNFDFKTHTTTASARQAILNMPQERHITCTGDALEYAHRHLFDPNTGIRSTTESVKEVLILTDGHSNCGAELTNNLRRLHVKAFVFALAIGNHGISGTVEIRSMVSRPMHDHIFSLSNFFDFNQMVDAMRTYPEHCVPFELS